ncbi:MAG: hypothetical protein ACREJC_18520 [Tepidisphaeraceae bacterium]
MRSSLIAMSLLISCIGCASAGSREIVAQYGRGKPAEVVPAPADGRYALFDRIDTNPILPAVALRKGQPIGFRKDTPNRVTAVAGADELTLQDGTYVWRRR